MMKQLNYIVEHGDEVDLKMVLDDIAKAKGMTTVAKEISATRESLYRSLNGQTKAQFDTIFKLIKSFRLSIKFVKTV